jgi:hypothetical protein
MHVKMFEVLLYNSLVLGPVSNASSNPAQISTLQICLLLICGAVLGAILSMLYWRSRQRIKAIRALANRLGFTYIGEALPRSLSLRGTSLEAATAVWNVIDGERNKLRLIAFDCRIGVGKGSWRRTVIAAQTDSDIFGIVSFNRDLTVERSGDWMFLYQPKTFFIPPGLMSIDEIEAHLTR